MKGRPSWSWFVRDFYALPKPVQESIRLLHTVRSKAISAIGNDEKKPNFSPITAGFGVPTYQDYVFVSAADKLKLEKVGWTKKTYEYFVYWYRCVDHFGPSNQDWVDDSYYPTKEKRNELLRIALSRRTLPPKHPAI